MMAAACTRPTHARCSGNQSCLYRWTVPLIWGSFSVACLTLIRLRHNQTLAASCSLILLGAILWQLAEYCIHRFLFHIQPSTCWGITIHFTFHGCHHKWPMDNSRLVFPPVPAALIVAAVFAAWHRLLPKVHRLWLCCHLLPRVTCHTHDCVPLTCQARC